MKKKTVGSGLTRYTVHSLGPKEWFKKGAKNPQFLARALPTYPERLLCWREWAIGVLAKAGSPTTNALVSLAADGTWSPYEPGSESSAETMRVISGLSYHDPEKEDSLEWFAAKILKLVNREMEPLRRKRGVGGKPLKAGERRLAQLASRAVACELGSTVERVRWKFRHEEAALFGYRQKDHIRAFQKSGVRTTRARSAETEKELEPLFRAAVKKTSRPINSLTIAEIIQLMRKLDPKTVKSRPTTTLRRYVKRLREKHL